MPLANVARLGRRPRVRIRRRRQTVPRARLTRLATTALRDHPSHRPAAAPIRVRSSSRRRDTGSLLLVGIELVRVLILLTLAVFAVIVVLPALLDFAASPSGG